MVKYKTEMNYYELVLRLNTRKQFSFSRFGDGEFACMFERGDQNCDGHLYFKSLGLALNAVIQDPKGVMGLQSLGYGIFKDKIDKLKIEWVDADIMHQASIDGELSQMIYALKHRNVTMVGPNHLRELTFYDRFIEVPLRNAWLDHKFILKEIDKITLPGHVIVYSCGMMAEVLIHEMYSERITQIDAGSVFDPYCGVKSRKYHYKLNV